MPNWPTNPEWIDLLNINKGSEYVAADGVTVTDMNSIINDLLYLKAHSSGGGSTNIQGENFTYRVAPGENIEAGSFVGVTGTYGDGIFTDVAVANNSIELCRSGNNVYVFFYDNTNNTNKVVCLSIDNETNQVIVSPQVNLGKIANEYAVTALAENNFIMCYALNNGISAKYMTIDFENGTAIIQEPIVAVKPVYSNYPLLRPRIVLGPDTKLYIFTSHTTRYSEYRWRIYSFDLNTQQTTWLYTSDETYQPYSDNHYVTDVRKIDEHNYVAVALGQALIVQLYSNTASVHLGTSVGEEPSTQIALIDFKHFATISTKESRPGSQTLYGVQICYCFIDTDNSIKILKSLITEQSSISSRTCSIVYAGNNIIYALYDRNNIVYNTKITLSNDNFDYQENAFVKISSTKNLGRCISLKENSFLWFYSDSAGKFTQRDENFIPIDSDVLGNIYVTKRLISRNQYIGIATTGAQSNQLINITVPYASYPIIVQTSNCTYTANAYVIGKDETVTLSFKLKDASYKFPSTVTVRNAKYIWNSTTGELTISEAKNTVYISVTAYFAGLYTYNTATVPDQGTATSLTLSVNCNVGDLIIAAFAIRSDLVSLSDGWTLISTSEKITENQTLSWAQKVAESTTESITVTQTSAARIYINLIALPGATSVIDNGYTTQNTPVEEITVNRPSGLVLFGLTASLWQTTKPCPVWTSSIKDMPIIQLGESMASRLGVAPDQTTESTVSFYPGAVGGSPVIVGSLTVQGITKFY